MNEKVKKWTEQRQKFIKKQDELENEAFKERKKRREIEEELKKTKQDLILLRRLFDKRNDDVLARKIQENMITSKTEDPRQMFPGAKN